VVNGVSAVLDFDYDTVYYKVVLVALVFLLF